MISNWRKGGASKNIGHHGLGFGKTESKGKNEGSGITMVREKLRKEDFIKCC